MEIPENRHIRLIELHPEPVDRAKCKAGEKRWNEFCQTRLPELALKTPDPHTLERMASCDIVEFRRLLQLELKAGGHL